MPERLRDDPVLRDALEVRTLSGLSRAQVFLMTADGKRWIVRKAAKTPSDSARLRGQVQKQLAFGAAMRDVVYTPRVLDEGEVDGRYFFDMEFVPGPDGASYLLRAPYDEVKGFAERMCGYLEAAAAAKPLAESEGRGLFEALFAKTCEVQDRTGLISDKNLSRLFRGLERVRRLGPMSPTLCHGDLTLQNIILNPEVGICVVDLLDAPFEHYWQDVAKLHQDVSGGWYLLEQPPVAQCVLDFVGSSLRDAATRLNEAYALVHPLLVASTFVRILPYTRSPEEQGFVMERVDHFARLTAG